MGNGVTTDENVPGCTFVDRSEHVICGVAVWWGVQVVKGSKPIIYNRHYSQVSLVVHDRVSLVLNEFISDSQQPFALVFDFSALLGGQP